MDEVISLEKKNFHHEINVLRKKLGDKFIVFDGRGESSLVQVIDIDKKSFNIKIIEVFPSSKREGIDIDLGLALIKNDPLNLAIQKATELGVNRFSPLITERVSVKRKDTSSSGRMRKWEQTAQGACEQCGENWIPKINEPINLKDWADDTNSETKIVLYPGSKNKLSDIKIENCISIAIGPEGDFTDNEVEALADCGFIPVSMGRRILRAETAAISVVGAVRYSAKEF
tara:strand:- start:819 stop:1505 length:687 start_codon:yes stop_codon:yes gene_type:complete